MNAREGRWWRPWLESEGVLVLHVDLRPDKDREARALEILDGEERRRWERFVVHRAKRQFSLCRAALRIELQERLGSANRDLSFGYGQHGKPFAVVRGEPSPVRFNVSHSGEHGLIGFAEHPDFGLDIEERAPGRDFEGLGETVYGPEEQRALAAAPGPAKAEVFYRFWTMKEALIKAIGTGFSLHPSRFEAPGSMIAGERSAVFHFPDRAPEAYWLEDVGEARFAAALAYRLAPSRRAAPSA